MEHVPVHICITAVKLFWHWTLWMVHVRYLWSYLSIQNIPDLTNRSPLFLFSPLFLVDSPTSGGQQQQQKTHDKQHHGHHLGLRQVIVGVGDTCPCYADHQRDDSKGKDAAVPGLLHAPGGLRQTLQRGEHLRHFGSTSLQGLSFLPRAGLGLVLAG